LQTFDTLMWRRFFKKKKVPEPKIELEEVSLDEIKSWLDNKGKRATEKEKEIFIQIKEKIRAFAIDIKEKTKALEEIDIESKKVEERAKIIVRQSLTKYLNFVQIFTKELTKIDKQNLEHFIAGTSKIFADFDKHSYIFYQRANYLIGDELLAAKQEINNLSKYFTDLFKQNKKITQTFNLISSVESNLSQFNETQKILDEINSDIILLDKETKEQKNKTETTLEKIEQVKVSKNYLENEKRKHQLESTKKQLTNNISQFKSLINFKKLANTFHSSPNKMKTIQEYKDNFQEQITENNKELLNLINEAKLNNNSIANQIQRINEDMSKISKGKKLLEKDEVNELLERIEKIKLELKNMVIEKVRHTKRKEKIGQNKKQILERIKANLTNLGGNLSN